MATFCPYCGEEIESNIYSEWVGDYLTCFVFECPKCGEEMEIDVEMDPVFFSHKKRGKQMPERNSKGEDVAAWEELVMEKKWFKYTLEFVLAKEGGYVEDSGGPTKFGISQKSYPKLDIKNLTEGAASLIYYEDYWIKLKCHLVPGPLAMALMDTGVNCGRHRAGIWLQESLNDLKPMEPLKVDADIGFKTLKEVNSGAGSGSALWNLIILFLSKRIDHYLALRRLYPQYLPGWIARVSDLMEALGKNKS